MNANSSKVSDRYLKFCLKEQISWLSAELIMSTWPPSLEMELEADSEMGSQQRMQHQLYTEGLQALARCSATVAVSVHRLSGIS